MVPHLLALLALGMMALFTYLAVAAWSEERRKEREAFYRSEVLKKLLDTGGADSARVLEMLREEEASANRRRREGLKVGGLVTLAVGVGLLVFLQTVGGTEPVHMAGLVPILVGSVLLLYAYLLAPR
jgi:ferric-dicitrate binding protein FerR (iron transport regulator)